MLSNLFYLVSKMSMKITIGVLLRLRLMDVYVVLYRDSQMVRPV